MKRIFKNSVVVILLFGTATYLSSCMKQEIPPLVATTNVSDITQTTALIGGKVTDDGGSEIMDLGVCWGTSPYPTISSDKTNNVTGSSSFTTIISGLTASTIYHVRAYATNSAGTSYGNGFTFSTKDLIKVSSIIFNPNLIYGAISDIDGNTYKTIQIGNQIWMAENLKTTRFNDGTLIPNVKNISEWENLKIPGYSWYNTEVSFKNNYGALYNWFTVNTGKICPVGWHIPSDAEWGALITYLGGWSIAGEKLMEVGSEHWLNPNTEATNITGFTGLPGGSRYVGSDFEYIDYSFNGLGYWSAWWSATEFLYSDSETGSFDYAWSPIIYSMDSNKYTGVGQILKNVGESVRCLKDN
jgi:uncharacterized protein (TIGR02145 family)